jgi:hypothetical protein
VVPACQTPEGCPVGQLMYRNLYWTMC